MLIHGLTASPWEMRYLGERLHAAGHSVRAVRLAGHGTSPQDLERWTWREWYATAQAGLRELAAGPPVLVVGQSMGALLAIRLAAEYSDRVAGVALLSPALRLSATWLQWMAPAFPALLPLLPQRYRQAEKGDADIADDAARAACPSYRSLPLRAISELVKLQRQARRSLSRVQAPILLLHAKHDHTCPLVNVDIVRRAVSGNVEFYLLEASYHVVSVDVERDTVAAMLTAFAARVLPSEISTPPTR